jgi:hypothetical protein
VANSLTSSTYCEELSKTETTPQTTSAMEIGGNWWQPPSSDERWRKHNSVALLRTRCEIKGAVFLSIMSLFQQASKLPVPGLANNQGESESKRNLSLSASDHDNEGTGKITILVYEFVNRI